GVHRRGLPAHARPAPDGRRLGGDGLAGGRGPRDRAQLAPDAGLPEDALLEGRAEREAARAAHAVRPRAPRGARDPAVRERGGVGLTEGRSHSTLKRIAPWAITLGIFAVLFMKVS